MDAGLTALSYAGLALLLGSLLARRWLTPGRPGLVRPAAGLGLLLLAWGAQQAHTLFVLGLAVTDAGELLTATASGRAVLTGLLGATLLLAAETGRAPLAALLLAAGLTLWGAAGVGHGSGHGPGLRLLHAAHAGAMSLWVGGVLTLTLARPLTPEHARRFTPVAVACVAVLALTGLLMAREHLGGLWPWRAGPYAQVLLLKLGLVALALGAALRVRRAFHRSAKAHRHLAGEALLLAAVLGMTSLLGTLAPPAGHPGSHVVRPPAP